MRTSPMLFVLVAALTGTIDAQILVVWPGVVAPGSTVLTTYVNNTQSTVWHPTNTSPVCLLHSEGELIMPRAPLFSAQLTGIPPGGIETGTFTLPFAGPGSSGSLVVLWPWVPRAVARVDVGAPSPSFPSIHPFPPEVQAGYGSHFVGSYSQQWFVGNTSGFAFTFSAGDQVTVYAPGGATPLASVSLAGISVGPGLVAAIPLPVGGLAPGPHTIAVSWNDPSAGPIIRRFGIHSAPYADLYLPQGKFLPFGGSVSTYANCSPVPSLATTPMFFVQLADLSAGSTFLPPGQQMPIVLDPVSLACVTSSLNGLIVNGQGVATPFPWTCPPAAYCGPAPYPPYYQTPLTTIFHPNVPGLTGTVLRLATLLYDVPGQRYVSTQGEELTIG